MGAKLHKARLGKLLQIRITEATLAYFERMRRFFGPDTKDGEVLKRILTEPDLWSDIAHDPFDEQFHLMKILQKIATRTALNRSEWMLLATAAHDAYLRTNRSRANVALYLDVLSAVLTLVHHVPDLKTREAYLIGNMPAGRDSGFKGGVASAIAEEITRLQEEAFVPVPRCEFGCRNLQVLLRDEQLSNMERLSQDLWPYVESLFCLAAKGFFYQHDRTFYTPQDTGDVRQHKGLLFKEGEVELHCHLTQFSMSGILKILSCKQGSVEIGFDSDSFFDIYYIFDQVPAVGESVTGDLFDWSAFAFDDQVVLTSKNGIRLGLAPELIPNVQGVIAQLLADKQAAELIGRLKKYYGDL